MRRARRHTEDPNRVGNTDITTLLNMKVHTIIYIWTDC